MQCSKCGKELTSSLAFCPFCGALISRSEEKVAIKKPASEYSAPSFEVYEKDTVYENPNKAYDNRANEFYKPHSLPHSDRRGSKRHRRRRKHRNRVSRIALPILAILFVLLGTYLSLRLVDLARKEVNIRGMWVADSSSEGETGNTYVFANTGFVTVTNPVYESTKEGTRYCWRVEGDTLIVDNTTYYWSTNLNDYSNPDREHWSVSGNTMYISNTHNDGYKILTRSTK